MVLVIRLEWEWEDSGRDGREERNEPSLWGVMVVTLIITHHVDFFLYIVIFWAEENQKYVHKIKEQYRQKSLTKERMVSQKDSNNQEEKARREKGRCPIPPPHALRIFFLLHVFLMSVQQFENFFDDRRVHLQWCVKRATTVWSAKACTCYVVVCASRHFLARKRRSWRRRRRWWRWVRVSGGRR